MPGKIARKFFLGQGAEHLGCAQAVAQALRTKFNLEDSFVQSMAKATGGRAPLGNCGALYAALMVAESNKPEKKHEIEEYFKTKAGGLTCREIRKARKLSCADCVEHATNLLNY